MVNVVLNSVNQGLPWIVRGTSRCASESYLVLLTVHVRNSFEERFLILLTQEYEADYAPIPNAFSASDSVEFRCQLAQFPVKFGLLETILCFHFNRNFGVGEDWQDFFDYE